MLYYIVKTCDVDLWGVESEERIEKILAKLGNFKKINNIQQVSAVQPVLVLRADYLLDSSLLSCLITCKNTVLKAVDSQFPIAGLAEGELLQQVVDAIENERRIYDSRLRILGTAELSSGYQARLRKLEKSQVFKITEAKQRLLENYLYGQSYKGVTDLVTKWVWFYPARRMVRWCVRFRVTPNIVTGIGWMLTIAASVLFYFGEFILGLILAWIMTFLDTVDGKLARVTLQSSKLGHLLDHGLDILHPPIWYWLWAVGTGVEQVRLFGIVWDIHFLTWIMLIAYLSGRLFEGLFQLLFNDISIFSWRPIDSYNRLITARRNPCLIILTMSIIWNAPHYGYFWVVFWTLASTVFLGYRFSMGCIYRIQVGPLISWIEQVDLNHGYKNLAVRLFPEFCLITGYQHKPFFMV